MVPPPMRPAQTALVIIATFLVAGGLFPWSARYRVACVAGVSGIVLVLFVARLRAHTGGGRSVPSEVQDRIDRIRAERAARMGRHR